MQATIHWRTSIRVGAILVATAIACVGVNLAAYYAPRSDVPTIEHISVVAVTRLYSVLAAVLLGTLGLLTLLGSCVWAIVSKRGATA